MHLHAYNSASGVSVNAWARVIYDDGTDALLTVPEQTLNAEIVEEDIPAADPATQDGWVVGAAVEMLTDGIQRGQTYVRLQFGRFGVVLLQDYCFSFNPVWMGTYVQPGPGGGAGNLELVTAKANGVPVASTFRSLALTDAIRKIHSFIWYYACSADVATRTLDVVISSPLGAIPTGFITITAEQVWVSTSLVLTASQNGSSFLDQKRSGVNDNGTLAIDDAATDPSPFPLLLEGGDGTRLNWAVSNLNANDNDALYILQETWVVL